MAHNAKQPCFYISQRGGRKKIHKDSFVYLRDKEEFDIELVNPTQDSILAKIEIDSKLISTSGIVIRPGERIVLKRFLDENKAFVFNTYEIDGSDQTLVNATSNNGKVKVSFYKEKTIHHNPYCLSSWTYPSWIYYPGTVTIGPSYPFNQPYIWCGSSGTGGSSITGGNAGTTYNINGTNLTNTGCSGSILTNTIGSSYSTGSTFTGSSYSTGSDYSCLNSSINSVCSDSLNNVSLETGRVEKGSITDQSFTNVSLDFESYVSYTCELQILPESRMPLEKADLNKVFCHACGRKSKPLENFCSDCGTKLNK